MSITNSTYARSIVDGIEKFAWLPIILENGERIWFKKYIKVGKGFKLDDDECLIYVTCNLKNKEELTFFKLQNK